MIIIEDKEPENEYYLSHKYDVERIQKVLVQKGYILTKKQCYELWIKYSNDYCAGWLIIGDDQEIINAFYGCADKIFNLKEEQQ